jgi:hypothetical protein
MISTATAQGLIRDLGDKLSKRLAGGAGLNTVVSSADANGWPVLTLSHNGNAAEGQPVLAIRIKGIDAVSKDVFGNSTYAYAPHELDFAYELASTGAPEVAMGDILTCFYESQKTGCAMTVKAIANGTAVTPASIDSTAAAEVLAPLYWRQATV